ncbi:LysR family transcriptional regulator [Kitasatospora sp. NPDC051853]|uniref:LysR family transcriptional regulator n=1 Tax=Kitasatospora sp. NPDC051853 TaxID=3364058 RepID=UPI00379C896F
MDIAMYQLRTFWEVSRLQSITKAGRKLGYSQSTITAHVRVLEAQVGTPLFQRLPHGVRLTEAGQIFHGYAARMLSAVDELSAALAENGEVTGQVSVGATGSLVDREVSRLIWEARYRYPRVTVSPLSMLSTRIPEEVAAGRLDLGLMMTSTAEPSEPPPAGVVRERLHELDLVCIGSLGLPGAEGDPVGRLREARILQVDHGCPSQEQVQNALQDQYGFTLEVMSAGSVGSALGLMRSGPFIAVLPEQSVAREVELGSVVLQEQLPRMRRAVWMLWRDQAWQPAAMVALLELARRVGQLTTEPVGSA